MRLAIPLALVLAAAASRDGCGNGARPPYEPCAGKACGEACKHCAPDDRDCVETTELKTCDPAGRCVSHVDGLCGAGAACAGKACGEECVVDPPCRSAVPPCMMPSALGHCDMQGTCYVGTPPPGFCLPPPPPVTSCEGQVCGVPCVLPGCPAGVTCGPWPERSWCDGAGACVYVGTTTCPEPPPPPPSWGCAGKRCGDSCGVCPEGTDPANCPVPTFAATACDARLQCVTVGTFSCPPPPVDDCLGKACGTSCAYPCPPGAPCPTTPVAPSCNGNQTCALPVPWNACYVPCAGKACGDTCTLCPPDAKDCGETTELKACDDFGRCVSRAGSFACRQ